MTLTSPLMLLGLLSLPLLVAIYWFRSRSRPVVVSSLALWVDQRRAKQGGRMLQRMQSPLSFFLELLMIGLLVLAAAGPALTKKDAARPLVVVLDDSYSMLARDPSRAGETPRRRAEAALLAELARDNYLARLFLAGSEPRMIGQSLQTPGEVRQVLAVWTCQSAWADLRRAVATAAEVGGLHARILVLTDQPPPMKLEGGQIEWRAYGAKLPNTAITAAARSAGEDKERVLLEVTNLGDLPAHTVLTLTGGRLKAPKAIAVELAAGASRQFFETLPAGSPAVQATIDDDALPIDNRVELLPETIMPLRVRVDLADANLRRAVVRALEATGMAILAADRPELIVGDRSDTAEGDAWRLEIVSGKDAVSYAGPFVVDRNHALSQGLSLEGAVWSAAPSGDGGGMPIVTAGDVPLLTDYEQAAGQTGSLPHGGSQHRLRLNFTPRLSNLQDMPDWPILWSNLLRWRRGALPGVATPNVRLGQTVAVGVAADVKQVDVVPPGAPAIKLDAHNRRVDVLADRIGLYQLKTPAAEYAFSCNAVSRDESDLSAAVSGRWGDWDRSPLYQSRQTGIGWLFVLLALGVGAGHLALVAARRTEFNPSLGEKDQS